jgi:YesN/AraC family two-component response regulator
MSKDSKYCHSGLGIYILKKHTLEVLSDELFNSKCFFILLVKSGSLAIQINDTIKHLSANEIIIIPVKAFCKVLNVDEKLQVYIMSFTSEFAFRNSIKKPYVGYFEFFTSKFPSKVSLNRKEVSLLINLFKLLEDNNKNLNRHIFQNEVLLFNFNLLLYSIAGIYHIHSHYIKIKHTRKEKFVIQFFTILETHCRKQHRVTFYANTLFVTAGHLNKTIKEITGKTAKQCIEEEIILEAKKMLQNDELTILSISEELQFSNPSFFSNFFKKHTSLSPSEYRSKIAFQ